ncbi:MAG: hypothetical protein ABIS67_06840 [Candidatus Eisenbacteria bacterium]
MRITAVMVLAFAAFAAPPIRAQAPPDTSFGEYLETLRDSTDVYFGSTVAPVDTAGLDSALAAGLARPPASPRRVSATWRPQFGPWLGFNRVDGPTYGATIATGRRRELGQWAGRAGYAVGSDVWLGSGGYAKAMSRANMDWAFTAEAGRWSASMDREHPDTRLAAVRAFVAGTDSRRYLRRDGLDLGLNADHARWRGRMSYRDMSESPLGVTARWSLLRSSLKVPDNLAAARGHTHELGYLLGARTPWVPFTAEAEHFSSSGRIGSDFDYRRTRLSLGGDLSIRRTFAVVPQVSYGRLNGDALPQASFYLGGMHSLRSLPGASRGGTGMVLAKLDVLELPDLLEVMRIPHPAMLPIQVGAFVATGAVWGVDPYGGPARPGQDWPNAADYVHEAGVSLIYRPGIPDPASFMQFSWAWPLGPRADGRRFSVSYSRGVDLVRPFGGDGP